MGATTGMTAGEVAPGDKEKSDKGVSAVSGSALPVSLQNCDWIPRIKPPDLVAKIATEQPFGVAERVYFHYDDPDVAMRSYSAVDVGGCTGTMIGPNVMLTAGHCGMGNRNATFRLYTAAATQRTESFLCQYLVHTFGDMDFNAFWCGANADGESPGDKFGYADLDIVVDPLTGELDHEASAALLTNGKPVYSVWMNPIDDIGGGWHSIYSEGMITETAGPTHWGSPNLNVATDYRCGNSCCNTGAACTSNCDTGACGVACTVGVCERRATRSVAAGTDLWTNGGSSGSGQFNSANHRYIIGPQSVGSSDGRGRGGLAVVNHLFWGFTDPDLTCPTCCQSCLVDQLNVNLLQSLGVANPSQFDGYIDYVNSSEDGLLDVQHAAELVSGENPRQWYWLGFESLRRNALWTKDLDPGVTFDTSDAATGIATVDTRGLDEMAYLPVLSHERLNLPPNRYYDVSVTTYFDGSVFPYPLRVCLEGTVLDCKDFDPIIDTWYTNVARLWASPGADLRIFVQGDALVYVTAVSLIEHGAVMGFDSHDKRFMWRNHNTGARARIWPNGIDSDTEPDWAGVVYREPSQPLDDDWSLRNRQLAIRGGEQYQVCFKYRTSDRDPLYAAWGTVRMLNEFGEIPDSKTFVDVSTTWGSGCTSWFAVPTDDNNLQFGVYAFIPGSSGAWLVDDVEIRSESLFADDFELGNLNRWSSSVGGSP